MDLSTESGRGTLALLLLGVCALLSIALYLYRARSNEGTALWIKTIAVSAFLAAGLSFAQYQLYFRGKVNETNTRMIGEITSKETERTFLLPTKYTAKTRTMFRGFNQPPSLLLRFSIIYLVVALIAASLTAAATFGIHKLRKR